MNILFSKPVVQDFIFICWCSETFSKNSIIRPSSGDAVVVGGVVSEGELVVLPDEF